MGAGRRASRWQGRASDPQHVRQWLAWEMVCAPGGSSDSPPGPQPSAQELFCSGLWVVFFLITFIKQYVVLKENLAADWKGLNYKVPQAPVGCVGQQAGTLCWCLDNRVQRRENSTRSLINQMPEAKAGPALGPKLQPLEIWMSHSRCSLVA